MKFNNRQNYPLTGPNGEEVWVSRSMAVVCMIINTYAGVRRWALTLRSDEMPDYQGFWCIPCGYLDWDETLEDCAVREVWEEIGLDITPWRDQLAFHSLESTPHGRQNVTVRFTLEIEGQPPRLRRHTSESDDVGWFTYDEIEEIELAFDHRRLIRNWEAKF